MEDKQVENKSLLGGWVFSKAFETAMLYGSKYYGGLIKLAVPRPFSADIHVSTKCNSRCITCNYWRQEARKNYAEHDLTIEQIEDILTQFKEIDIRVVGLGGAEPLIRKDIGQIIKTAKEIVGGKVYLTTNGLLLEKKAQILVENGIDHVSVSIDGIGETNDKIRGIPGDFERAVRGIKTLKKLIDEKDNCACVCNIGTTMMQSNIDEIPQLLALAKQLGTHWNFNLLDSNISFASSVDLSELFVSDRDAIDRIFTYLHQTTKKASEAFILDPASLKYSKKYLKDKTPYQHCYLGYYRIYVDSFLNVYPGCVLLPPVGNLQSEHLKNIIESKLYAERTRQMVGMECPGCTCGYLHNCMIEELPSTLKYFFNKLPVYRKYL